MPPSRGEFNKIALQMRSLFAFDPCPDSELDFYSWIQYGLNACSDHFFTISP
jgi:hypothetical protein